MPEILDRTVLERLSELNDGSSPDIVTQLASVFQEVTPKRLADLEAAASAGDHENTFMAAHSLKSGSASLGLKEMSGLAARLESAARAKDGPAVKELLAELKKAWERASAELAKHLKERNK